MAEIIKFKEVKKKLEKKGYTCPITTGVGHKSIVCSTKEARVSVSQDRLLGYEIEIWCKNLDKCEELYRILGK